MTPPMTRTPSARRDTPITVTIRLPSRDLSPNGRCHWARKARAVKAYRNAAWAESLIAMTQNMPIPRWKRATIEATYYLRDRRGLVSDQDNRISSLKSAVDGLVDAGILADDRGVTWKPVAVLVDRQRPRVELKVIGELAPAGGGAEEKNNV